MPAEKEANPLAGRSLQSLAKSLSHHLNRLKTRLDAAERLAIHVQIWPGGPAAGRLEELKQEMAEDWEQCNVYATEITQRVASALEGLDPSTIGLTSHQWEVASDGHASRGTASAVGRQLEG